MGLCIRTMTIEETKEFLKQDVGAVFSGVKYDLNGYFSYKFRQFIYKESNYRCFYCKLSLSEMHQDNPPQIDHVTPRVDGGTDDIWNLVLSCRTCNLKKGSKEVGTFCLLQDVLNSKEYKEHLLKVEYYKKLFHDIKNNTLPPEPKVVDENGLIIF